jgi:hypothetical protein
MKNKQTKIKSKSKSKSKSFNYRRKMKTKKGGMDPVTTRLTQALPERPSLRRSGAMKRNSTRSTKPSISVTQRKPVLPESNNENTPNENRPAPPVPSRALKPDTSVSIYNRASQMPEASRPPPTLPYDDDEELIYNSATHTGQTKINQIFRELRKIMRELKSNFHPSPHEELMKSLDNIIKISGSGDSIDEILKKTNGQIENIKQEYDKMVDKTYLNYLDFIYNKLIYGDRSALSSIDKKSDTGKSYEEKFELREKFIREYIGSKPIASGFREIILYFSKLYGKAFNVKE